MLVQGSTYTSIVESKVDSRVRLNVPLLKPAGGITFDGSILASEPSRDLFIDGTDYTDEYLPANMYNQQPVPIDNAVLKCNLKVHCFSAIDNDNDSAVYEEGMGVNWQSSPRIRQLSERANPIPALPWTTMGIIVTVFRRGALIASKAVDVYSSRAFTLSLRDFDCVTFQMSKNGFESFSFDGDLYQCSFSIEAHMAYSATAYYNGSSLIRVSPVAASRVSIPNAAVITHHQPRGFVLADHRYPNLCSYPINNFGLTVDNPSGVTVVGTGPRESIILGLPYANVRLTPDEISGLIDRIKAMFGVTLLPFSRGPEFERFRDYVLISYPNGGIEYTKLDSDWYLGGMSNIGL